MIETQLSHIDVAIIGAGLSGIAAAHHIQSKCPNRSYSILEARASMGGTWDLFRYPGVRSDSDMYTLGYPFRPWLKSKTLAEGPAILDYIRDTAREARIEQHIAYGKKLLAASWSSVGKRWTLTIESGDATETMTCCFLFMCTGYYDYDGGFQPEFPGLKDFKGQFVHPQKWTSDIATAQKNIIVIGSGATAVTLVPELAKTAAHVTMLQRTPSYVISLPSVDKVALGLKNVLPKSFAHHLIRLKNILLATSFYNFCRKFPEAAKKVIMKALAHQLPLEQLGAFTPSYQPWDQRVCFVPDGDLFKAIRAKKAEVVTDTIESFTESGLRLSSGRHLAADLVVSATGLKVKFLAGLQVEVDGKPINLTSLLPYKGAMFSGLPNFAMAFGYTNASWTLKCDLICQWVAKIVRHMEHRGYDVVMPEASPAVNRKPLIDLSSGYLQRAQGSIPHQGDRAPWTMSQNYFADLLTFKVRPLADKGLNFK